MTLTTDELYLIITALRNLQEVNMNRLIKAQVGPHPSKLLASSIYEQQGAITEMLTRLTKMLRRREEKQLDQEMEEA